MEKLMSELQRQEKEEYEKKEVCDKQSDKLEDEIKVGKNTKDGKAFFLCTVTSKGVLVEHGPDSGPYTWGSASPKHPP